MSHRSRRSLLFERDFCLVWLSGAASWTGNLAMFVVLPMAVYQRTDSPLATAITVLGAALPPATVGQVAGVVVDRWDRRRLLVAANLAMAGLTTVYLALAGSTPWWTLSVASLVVGSVGQLLGPAGHALLPELVPRDRLGEGASLNALNNNLGRLLGPALGGLLSAQLGFAAAVVFSAATYLLAGVLVAAMSSRRPFIPARAPRRPNLAADWVEGALTVWRHLRLRGLVALMALLMFGEGFVSTLLAPLAQDVIGGGAQTLGLILSAQAVGGIAGAWWASRIADRRDPFALLGAGALVCGLLLVVTFNYAWVYPRVWPAIVLTAIAGIPFAVVAAAQTLALQVYSPPRLRGRVFSLTYGVLGLTQLVGIVMAGAAGERWGPVVINVDAAVYVLAGLLALVLARRRSARG